MTVIRLVVRTSGFHPGNRGSIPLWTTKRINKPTLINAYLYLLKSMERLEGVEFAHNTIRSYRSSFNSVKRFVDSLNLNKRGDVRLCDLNHQFVKEYFSYLRSIEKLQSNSAFKNIKNLYRVIRVSIHNGWLNTNPFVDFPCHYKNPERPYLTEDEIKTLYKTPYRNERHIRVKDLFLFQIYTGLSYSDMTNLTSDNIKLGIDGKPWIIIHRAKTGNRCAIPLLPIASEILTKYRMILPKYSNQKLNKYLKEVAQICNISKILTSHCGRHTFATTICLNNGIPIETVSKLLGHSSLATTQIYAKITDRKVSEDMLRLFIKPVVVCVPPKTALG
jgi:site-specific recombinase XerD